MQAPVLKAILSALSERDETAEICRDEEGHPEPDPELRDSENVPLAAGEEAADEHGVPASVRAYFERAVTPHVPDAWIKMRPSAITGTSWSVRWATRRPLEQNRDPHPGAGEKEILEMLRDVTGSSRV